MFEPGEAPSRAQLELKAYGRSENTILQGISDWEVWSVLMQSTCAHKEVEARLHGLLGSLRATLQELDLEEPVLQDEDVSEVLPGYRCEWDPKELLWAVTSRLERFASQESPKTLISVTLRVKAVLRALRLKECPDLTEDEMAQLERIEPRIPWKEATNGG